MPSTITGGAFQDALGNPLANGFLVFVLSQDAQVASSQQVVAGYEVTISLDGNGNASGSVWANDLLSPAGTFYNVSAYSANGQLVWGPNAQQVLSTPSPFNIGTWIPASINVSAGGGGGGGTVTAVSVATANGISGTSSGGTTPALTLSLGNITPSNITVTDGSTSNIALLNVENSFTGFQNYFGGLFSSGQLVVGTTSTASPSENFGSNRFIWTGSFWNGSAPAQDLWVSQLEFGTGSNPSSTLTIAHQLAGTTGPLLISLHSDTEVIGNLNTHTLGLTSATIDTSATAGSASALPATPTGYVEVTINGTVAKIPFYS